MHKEKTIEVLNSLLEINNDRIEGYNTAIQETKDADLKSFFNELKETSVSCNKDLLSEVNKFGGKPEEGTKTTGKLYRTWMDFKATLTGNDRKTILKSCEFGEEVAVNTYQKAIENDLKDITLDQQTLIKDQYVLIRADQTKVKAMVNFL
jgi:uncharacterized protein (TIGR02284 family)